MITGRSRVAPEKAVFRPALAMPSLPAFTGEHMATKLTYREQLLHPNWQRKRLEVMQRDEFRCQRCMDTEATLHVHHKQYAKGRMAWEYPTDELVTLCEVCHEGMHLEMQSLRDVTAKLPVDGPGSYDGARAILAGWAHGQQGMDFQDVYDDNPYRFVLGQVAQELEDKLAMVPSEDLRDALRGAPAWVVADAATTFIRALRDRANEPPPPGYVRGLDDDDLF